MSDARGPMTGSASISRALAAVLAAATLVLSTPSAQAQFWDWGNRPQRQQRDFSPFGGWFGPPRFDAPRQAPVQREVDFSRAPPPEKKKAEATTSVLVLGDANADWLASG